MINHPRERSAFERFDCHGNEYADGSLVGFHKIDRSLHLGVAHGHMTLIACGAMLALVSDHRGTAPTQHTPWTADREAFDNAPNACPACKAKAAHEDRDPRGDHDRVPR